MGTIEIITRGLWLHGDRVLLCRNIAEGYAYLPGGHVEFGESADEALRREFMEETGIPVVTGPPLLLVEQAFTQSGKKRHELTTVFHVEHPYPPEFIESLEAKIAFDWAPIAVMPEIDLRPVSIQAWLIAGGSDGSCPHPAWLSTMRQDGQA